MELKELKEGEGGAREKMLQHKESNIPASKNFSSASSAGLKIMTQPD